MSVQNITAMPLIAIETYLGSYLLKMQMLRVFCFTCHVVTLTVLFNLIIWLVRWYFVVCF